MIHIALNFSQGAKKAIGISTYLNNLMSYLIPYAKKQGYHFHLFTANPPVSSLPKKHFTFHSILMPEGIRDRKKRIKAYEERLVEAMVTHTPKIKLVFFQNFELARNIKKLHQHDIRILVNIHDLIEVYLFTPNLFFNKKRDYNPVVSDGIKQFLFLRFQAKHLSGILTVSEASKKQILGLLPSRSPHRSTLTVTPLGTETRFEPCNENAFKTLHKALYKKHYDPVIELSSTPKPPLKKRKLSLSYKKFILYFSGHNRQKNVIFGMRGCIQAIKTYPQLKDFKVVIIANSHRWTPKLIEEDLHKDLIFLKDLDKDSLAVLISAARFTIHPSLMEGFGLPVLESVRAHTLPICSDISASKEMLGEDYPLFNPFDLNSLKELIGYFGALRPKEETALKNKLLKRTKRYSWKETARLTHEVFQRVLNYP